MKLSLNWILVFSFIGNINSIFTPDNKDIEDFIRASHSQRIRPELRAISSPFNIPLGIINSKIGTEEDARYFFNANGLSYCPIPIIEASNGTYGQALSDKFKVLKVFENKTHETLSYLAEREEKKELIMTFRGSINQNNWNMNFRLWQVALNDTMKNIKVHSGFKVISDSMAPTAIDYLKELFNQTKYQHFNLVVTGHSLGGALATLSILKYQESLQLPWSRFRLITYGSPRVGNKPFANLLNSKPMISTRVVNQRDPIPRLPDIGYSHIQSELYIKENQTIICNITSFEDSKCSLGAWFVLDRPAHSTAWGLLLDNKYC